MARIQQKNHINTALMVALLCILSASEQINLTAQGCGGNCNTGKCRNCLCGTQMNVISLDDYCSISTKWSANCCKCVADRMTGGNANYVAQDSYGITMTIGVLAIYYFDAQQLCGIRQLRDLCDPTINIKCGQTFYAKYGWKYFVWNNFAKTCGCTEGQLATEFLQ